MIINATAQSIPLTDNCIDAVVTDAPYGISFMGKKWDYDLPSLEIWQEVYRVMKPGAHLLAFGGTRTYHRAVCRIEDAGFEIRDCLMWIFGSGFPKSLDVSKAIDKAAGAERKTIGVNHYAAKRTGRGQATVLDNCGPGLGGMESAVVTAPATEAAKRWAGWGTALKPAYEPIVLARKPLDGTVAENAQEWGCGALNIDGCRVETNGKTPTGSGNRTNGNIYAQDDWTRTQMNNGGNVTPDAGRWPANVILDGSDEVIGLFPVTKGGIAVNSKRDSNELSSAAGWGYRKPTENYGFGDNGSAARFFYTAKASKSEREAGLDDLPERTKVFNGQNAASSEEMKPVEERFTTRARNHHPTVKPLALMRYLCKLITPPNGLILDPFGGSGSTGVAAEREGFRCIILELMPEYSRIAKLRNEHEVNRLPLFSGMT